MAAKRPLVKVGSTIGHHPKIKNGRLFANIELTHVMLRDSFLDELCKMVINAVSQEIMRR